ncbi:MAG: glycoside hydrolase family 20 zincin-like fold domain-containing protein [Planctomycetota bacterium]|nr:glycoside hydrolase family 20 zincin-like fold domain-containing protein [Planctomycetota bacterium]
MSRSFFASAAALAVATLASASGGSCAEAIRCIPQPQDVLIRADGGFPLRGEVPIVTKDAISAEDEAAIELLSAGLEKLTGARPKTLRASEAAPGAPAIFLGEPGKGNAALDRLLESRGLKLTAEYPGPEGYVIDAAASGVAVAGFDRRGTLYGAATLAAIARLGGDGQGGAMVPAVRIVDFPDMAFRSAYAIRCWNFSPERMERARESVRRLARLKFNIVAIADRNYAMLDRDIPGMPGKKVRESLGEIFEYARRWHLAPRVDGPAFYFPPGSYSDGKRPAPEASDPTTLAAVRYTATLKIEGEKEVVLEIADAKSGARFPAPNVLYDLKTGKSWDMEPVAVTSEDEDRKYEEGKDFAVRFGGISMPFFSECSAGRGQPPEAPRIGKSANPPSAIRRIATGSIRDGETVKVTFSYLCPDTLRPGKFHECIADRRLLTDGDPENYVYRWCSMPAAALKADHYCLSADERRCIGYDARSATSGKTKSELFADFVHYQYRTIRKAAPGARIFMWSDMADPNHNAAIYGLGRVAAILSKYNAGDIVMVPWFDGVAEASLRFFHEQNFGVMPSVQGDGPDRSALRWAYFLRKIYPTLLRRCGLQYTSWDVETDFSDEKHPALRTVAQAAWSAGPYIQHIEPKAPEPGKDVEIEAVVSGDAQHYVPRKEGSLEKGSAVEGEKPLKSVTLYFLPPEENAYEPVEMKRDGAAWKGTLRAPPPGTKYYIEADDGERKTCAPRLAPKITFQLPGGK